MFLPASNLNFANANEVLEAGLRAIEAGQTTIDLGSLLSVDSSAVAILLAWRRAAEKKGAALELTQMPSNLQSLTELYGVSALLHATPRAAPASAIAHH
ncbi:STAS domain-containing protein [Herbaspirillum sp. RTI4]|nr:STAS domain-containing protein [Herbaspirillum sp. RTI4]MDY7577741.1 STAS domain-containing protein [Herbaspirillum sp. RTI4]MEA9980831.1 STAS domain-containing protein [Herbaspirillum sp. RTI4]